jgi:hypothetical protein
MLETKPEIRPHMVQLRSGLESAKSKSSSGAEQLGPMICHVDLLA